jgi:hypothetical protein
MYGRDLPVLVQPTASPEIPPLTSGFTVGAGLGDIGMNFIVPRAVLDGLAEQAHASAVGFSTGDFAFRIGKAGAIPVTGLSVADTAMPESGDLTLPATGKNGQFTLPAAGDYDIKLPATFTGVLSTDATGSVLSGPCTIAEESSAVVGALTVTKQGSHFTAADGPKKPVKKGKAAKIKVALQGDNKLPTGKVVAKEGKKTVGTAKLKKGKATISVKGLKPGTHTIIVSYAGDKSTSAAGDTFPITVTVKK